MNRNLITLAICSGVVAGISTLATGADNELPTLFVAPFQGDAVAIQYWQPALGSGLSEMMITEIGKINKFQVLESTQLEALKDEIKMGQDGWIEPSEKVEKGNYAAADFMFTAKVTQFGSKQSNIGLGGFVPGSLGSLGVKQSVSDVRIDWRLVDAATRKVIKTGDAKGQQKGTGFNIGVNVGGNGGNIGFGNKEFMDSALGHATLAALSQITDALKSMSVPESGRTKLKASQAGKQAAAVAAAADALRTTPGKVVAVAGKDAIIVSLGSKQGFKPGDKLNLYQVNEIKDDKGAVVFSDDKLVGELTIQTTQDEASKASYSGDLDVKAGWKVKAK